jgi:cytochrome c oxidase cbb3-type subunit 3
MNDDPEVRRGHAYDGITEFDNRLPESWLWSFYLACIFAFFYWMHYHVLKTGALPGEEYQAELAELDARLATVQVTDEMLLARAADPAGKAAGEAVFQTYCMACHGSNGGGTMQAGGQTIQLPGPNLTDAFWLHGGKPTDILRTVRQGVPNTAMVEWAPKLGAGKCQDVAAYVLSLRNTNVPGGKEPQGREQPDIATR